MKKINVYLLCLLSAFCLLSCEKEKLNITETIEDEDQRETTTLVEASLSGQVINVNGSSIGNAKVDLKVKATIFGSTWTDEKGFFEFTNVMLSESNTVLRVSHPEFSDGYKVPILKEGIMNFADIQLNSKSTDQFDAAELIVHKSDILSFQIESDQLSITEIDKVFLDVSITEKEDIISNGFIPVEAVNDAGSSYFLTHQFVFDIRLRDKNHNEIFLKNGEDVRMTVDLPFVPSTQQIWYFKEDKAVWQLLNEGELNQNNSLLIDQFGLYSISDASELTTIEGQFLDIENNPVSGVNVQLLMGDNSILNETLSDGDGQFKMKSLKDFDGSIKVTKGGYEEANLNEQQLTESDLIIRLAEEVQRPKCLSVTLISEPWLCTDGPIPSELTSEDITGLSDFKMIIEDQQGNSQDPKSFFSDIEWFRIPADVPLNYTFSYVDNENKEISCTGEMMIIDDVPPVPVCHISLSLKLNEDGQVKLFASDVDQGSHDAGCSEVSLSLANQVDCAWPPCEKEVFEEFITFNTDDLNKEIKVVLQVVDGSGNANYCIVTIEIVE